MHRLMTTIASGILLTTIAGCAGSGGAHSGAAPAVAQASALVAKLTSAGLKCEHEQHITGFVGATPRPQEAIDCVVAGNSVEITRYRTFDDISAALRSPQAKNVCALSKAFSTSKIEYLYGDNWIVSSDPKFPSVTKSIKAALKAGSWLLHC